MPHRTKDKADSGVGFVLADLMANGYKAAMPLSDHLPFDMIAVSLDGKRLCRLQVKFKAAKEGRVSVHLETATGTKWVPLDLDQIDAVAVYCPNTAKVYYVRKDELRGSGRGFDIRITPARNGQSKGVRIGDSLVGPTRLFHSPAIVAQPVEHVLGKNEVAGSIPADS